MKKPKKYGHIVIDGVVHDIGPANEWDDVVTMQVLVGKAWSGRLEIPKDQWRAIVNAEYWKYVNEESIPFPTQL